jgi:hypothetical protein
LQASDLTDLFQVGNPVNLEQNQRWSSLAMGFDSQSCESIWQLGNPVKLAQLRGERTVLYFVLTMFRSIWATLRLASKSKVKFPLWLAILWVNLTTWQSSQVGKITQETYLIVPCFDGFEQRCSLQANQRWSSLEIDFDSHHESCEFNSTTWQSSRVGTICGECTLLYYCCSDNGVHFDLSNIKACLVPMTCQQVNWNPVVVLLLHACGLLLVWFGLVWFGVVGECS